VTALEELVTALRSARELVFRLESEQDYPDDPQWIAYQAGQAWEQNEDLAEWTSLVRANRDRGVPMERVHVVVPPWTDYVRFEVERHYPHNLAAGEDVRLVHAARPWPVPDFWLVDYTRAWLLDYDRDGNMTVIEATERSLPYLRRCRQDARAASVPLPVSATR